jgi:hypothetical protein
MRSLILMLSLLLVTAGCERASEPQKPPASQPQEAAGDGLSVLKKMVNEQNYRAIVSILPIRSIRRNSARRCRFPISDWTN